MHVQENDAKTMTNPAFHCWKYRKDGHKKKDFFGFQTKKRRRKGKNNPQRKPKLKTLQCIHCNRINHDVDFGFELHLEFRTSFTSSDCLRKKIHSKLKT